MFSKFHPDYRRGQARRFASGPNKGEELTTEVADILEAHSMIGPS